MLQLLGQTQRMNCHWSKWLCMHTHRMARQVLKGSWLKCLWILKQFLIVTQKLFNSVNKLIQSLMHDQHQRAFDLIRSRVGVSSDFEIPFSKPLPYFNAIDFLIHPEKIQGNSCHAGFWFTIKEGEFVPVLPSFVKDSVELPAGPK